MKWRSNALLIQSARNRDTTDYVLANTIKEVNTFLLYLEGDGLYPGNATTVVRELTGVVNHGRQESSITNELWMTFFTNSRRNSGGFSTDVFARPASGMCACALYTNFLKKKQTNKQTNKKTEQNKNKNKKQNKTKKQKQKQTKQNKTKKTILSKMGTLRRCSFFLVHWRSTCILKSYLIA